KRVEIVHMGCDISADDDGGEQFRRETGLSDFVLCVGRLETRKNQLMLLKALETSELPIVLGTGGFASQPRYETACRAFRRAGRTHFIGKVEPALLKSMYSAARVHALPSWYELPGLVSLEAAACGATPVVSDFGTARDYFGSAAFYAR